jgi:uncharacterized protein
MTAGSVPMAFLGAYLLHLLGNGKADQLNVERALGAALLVGASAMVFRWFLDRRSSLERTAEVRQVTVRPVPTLLIGMVGGLIVGMTSVGSGSLMIVLLLLLYPQFRLSELVGTDLVQAIPLVASAAVGHVLLGDFKLALTGSILVGAIPGVYLGARFSSRAPDGILRPLLVIALSSSALKLLGVGNTVLLFVIGAVAALLLVLAIPDLRRAFRRQADGALKPEPAQPTSAT